MSARASRRPAHARLMLRLTFAACITLGGCARMHPGEGFDDVQAQVRTRTGADTRWNRDTPEDDQVRAALDALLAQPLTADAAVQVALLNNRNLQATYEELDIAQADLVRAGLLKNPIFSADFRFDTSGGGTGIDLGIAQDFLSLLAIPLRRTRAAVAFEGAKGRITAEAVALASDARTAFFAHEAALETQAFRATITRAAEASYTLAQRLRAAGNTRELDLLREQTLLEQARLVQGSADAEVSQSRERLNMLMGLWGPDTAWSTQAHLPPLPDADPPLEDIEPIALRASLTLAQSRAAITDAALAARLTTPLRWLDGADIGASAQREVSGGWSVGPAFSIPIPIFDLGSATRAEARARLRQASDRYYAAAVEVRGSARAASAALTAARARVVLYNTTILPLQARLLEETLRQYNAMQVSGLELLSIRREGAEAGAASITALQDYWSARVTLDRLIGGVTPAAAHADTSDKSSQSHLQPAAPAEHAHGAGANP